MILQRLISLLAGWALDLSFGDPATLPHPVVWFGRMIGIGEKWLNKGRYRLIKGAAMALVLVVFAFFTTALILIGSAKISWFLPVVLSAILIFYCLAGTSLIREVREVFRAVDRSVEEGRIQVGRIVGRDTSELTAQEIRTAALETLAENLSDGVIAPLFWLAILGVPGMVTYKMINTMDSMIGYRTERYKDFGCFAARLDDIVNFIPARLTAMLMILCGGRADLIKFVWKEGAKHLSPNSGYPEAALAGILDCRFGGPHNYFGEEVYKPFIGSKHKDFNASDMEKAVKINRLSEVAMIVITATVMALF